MKTIEPGRDSTTPEPEDEISVDEIPALAFTLVSAEPPQAPPPLPKRRARGFAAMDRATVRELARRGAAAAHASGNAHRFTSEEAREAGRKGGRAAHRGHGPASPSASPATK